MNLHIPEGLVPIELLTPASDAAGRTSSPYASLKNAVRAWIVVHIAQGNAGTVALTPVQATAVAGTGSKVLTNAVPIWANQDAGTAGNSLARQTDAANLTTSAAVKHKVVVFQIDPAACMDINGGFDCIGLTTGASHADNITAALLLVESKYPQATPPDFLAN